jgi:hypothetical protein
VDRRLVGRPSSSLAAALAGHARRRLQGCVVPRTCGECSGRRAAGRTRTTSCATDPSLKMQEGIARPTLRDERREAVVTWDAAQQAAFRSGVRRALDGHRRRARRRRGGRCSAPGMRRGEVARLANGATCASTAAMQRTEPHRARQAVSAQRTAATCALARPRRGKALRIIDLLLPGDDVAVLHSLAGSAAPRNAWRCASGTGRRLRAHPLR